LAVSVLMIVVAGAATGSAAAPLAPAPGDASYFPLVEGTEYTYRGTFMGKTYTDRVGVRKLTKGDATGFYFVKFDDAGKPTLVLTGNMIGHGLLFTSDTGLATVDVLFTADVDSKFGGTRQSMFSFPLTKGGKHVVKAGKGTWTYTVVGTEDVTVPLGAFKDCMKIKINEDWETAHYEGYAWLAKGVGVVKWQRSTGRVDELVSIKKSK